MSDTKIYWQFVSIQGDVCNQNRDAFALLQTQLAIWVVAIDVATTSVRGTELSHHIIEQVEKELLEQEPVNVDLICECIKRIHVSCRNELKVGKASLCLVWIPSNDDKAYSISCGDCRTGVLHDEVIDWLTPVHTGANYDGKEFAPTMVDEHRRHILTRCFNLQRQLELEVTAFRCTGEDGLIVATDGFWAEASNEAQQGLLRGEVHKFTDDASALVMSGEDRVANVPLNNNQSENLFVMGLN